VEPVNWTLASIVAAFVVMLIFAPTLADLFSRILPPLETLIARPAFTKTGRALFEGSAWLYFLMRGLLTNPVHLTLLLAVSLILMAFRVVGYPRAR